ncbi:MAG: flagellar hook-associated protein FlgK, partial [Psychromonas sp.]
MADLFNIGLSGIHSSQANLATTSNNIANINTEGYSRQSVEVEAAKTGQYGSYFIGNGSIIVGVERAYDQFAYTENLANTSQYGYAKEVYQQTSQLDTLLSSEGTSVAKPVLKMFNSLNDVADNPNALEARKVFLENAKNVISQYNLVYDGLETQYTNINHDITNTAKVITTLAENIASLNVKIAAVLSDDGVDSNANSLLDERDQTIQELSQYVDVSVVDTESDMVNVYIGSGQSLVMGVSSLKLIALNGQPDPSRKELALTIDGNKSMLDGRRLGGSLAGLFHTRDNDVESALNQLGQNIIGLTHSINEQQREGMTLEGELGNYLFNDVNSSTSMRNRALAHNDGLGNIELSVRIDNINKLTADEYKLVVDAYQLGPPETISFTATNTRTGKSQVIAIDDLSTSKRVHIPNSGISIGIDSLDPNNPPQVGKSFTLRPTRLAAQEASLVVDDSKKVAAAGAEIKALAGSHNSGNAILRTTAINDFLDPLYMDADSPLQIVITAVDNRSGEITYNIADEKGTIVTLPVGSANTYQPEKVVGSRLAGLRLKPDPFTGKVTFNVAGVEVEMRAGKAQAGDTFTLNYNETGNGDNSNILEVAYLQNLKLMNEGKSTFSDIYSALLS